VKLMMFAKCLQEYPLEKAGRALKDLGIPGMDLTVRSDGYIKREEATEKLPAAVQTLAQIGIEVPMLTTDITSVDEDYVEDVFAAAADCGVQWMKLGYWYYQGFGALEQSIYEVKSRVIDLEPLAKQYGVWIGLHIHSGYGNVTANGAVVWEILRGRNPQYVGAYIDPAHMVVEGALSVWKQCLDLLAPWIKLVAVKDIKFVYNPAGDDPKSYGVEVVPLAEGMTPWPEVLELLSQIGFDGGITIHSDYIGGQRFRDIDADGVVAQTREDLAYLKPMLYCLWLVPNTLPERWR